MNRLKALELVRAINADVSIPPSWQSWKLCEAASKEGSFGDRTHFFDYAYGLTDHRVQKALLAVWSFNMIRQISTVTRDELREEMENVRVEVMGLSESDYQSDLKSGFGYNAGVTSRDIGDHVGETKYQIMSAEGYEALRNTQSAAISRFLVITSTINAVLTSGSDTAVQKRSVLGVALPDFYDKLAGHGWLVNLALHRFLANAWAGELDYDGFDEDLKIVEPFKEKFPQWYLLMQAVRMVVANDDIEETIRELQKAETLGRSKAHGDVVCTALLLLGGYYQKQGRTKQAIETYARLAAWDQLKGTVAKYRGQLEAAKLAA